MTPKRVDCASSLSEASMAALVRTAAARRGRTSGWEMGMGSMGAGGWRKAGGASPLSFCAFYSRARIFDGGERPLLNHSLHTSHGPFPNTQPPTSTLHQPAHAHPTVERPRRVLVAGQVRARDVGPRRDPAGGRALLDEMRTEMCVVVCAAGAPRSAVRGRAGTGGRSAQGTQPCRCVCVL